MAISGGTINNSSKMIKKSFFEKVEDFFNSYKQITIVIFMVLLFFRQCSINNDISRINKKETVIENRVDSLSKAIDKSITENKSTIEALLLVIDNKNLKISNDELYKNLRKSDAQVSKLLKEQKNLNK